MNINGHHFCLLNGVLTPEECQHFIKLLDVPDLHRVESTMATYDRNITIFILKTMIKNFISFFCKGNHREELKLIKDAINGDAV